MLGDWIIPFVYNIGMTGFRASVFAWLFMGGLPVIERMVNERELKANQAGPSDAEFTNPAGLSPNAVR
jgi:hypothetical protein